MEIIISYLSLSVASTLALPLAVFFWILKLKLLFKKGVLVRKDMSGAIGKFVKLSHGTTHYYLSGPENGPLVVFIHGFSIPSQPYIESGMDLYYVKQGYRILTVDLYGRGHSDAPDTKYMPELFIGQLIELLYVLDIKEEFDIVGYSMGGAFALYFAKAYPELVRKMVLISSAGVKVNIKGLVPMLKTPILGEALFKFFSDDFLNPKRIDEKVSETPMARYTKKQMEHQGYKRSLYSTLINFKLEDLDDLIQEVASKNREVLIIHGKDDYLIPLKSAEILHEKFQGSKLITFKGSHTMLIEKMPQVHEAIMNFL